MLVHDLPRRPTDGATLNTLAEADTSRQPCCRRSGIAGNSFSSAPRTAKPSTPPVIEDVKHSLLDKGHSYKPPGLDRDVVGAESVEDFPGRGSASERMISGRDVPRLLAAGGVVALRWS
jgi:hypothetical protein